jgi:hypothetical protein
MNSTSLVEVFFESSTNIYILCLFLGINLALTLVHSVQELRGTLWRYFGAIVGLRIPDRIGFAGFFAILVIALWAIGFAGIIEYLPIYGRVSPEFSTGCVAALIGGRISDSLFSHIRLDRQGYRPNPGPSSVPYYLAEAALLSVLFLPGFWKYYIATVLGFSAGWLFFFSVIPSLRLVRLIFPSWRRDAWHVGEQPM